MIGDTPDVNAIDDNFARFTKILAEDPAKSAMTLTTGAEIFGTSPMVGVLTKTMAERLDSGKSVIVSMGEMKYVDDVGDHEGQLCVWLQAPVTTSTNRVWHVCPNASHNFVK